MGKIEVLFTEISVKKSNPSPAEVNYFDNFGAWM